MWNWGTGPLDFEIALVEEWAEATPDKGVIAVNETITVDVEVDRVVMPVGTNENTLWIDSNGGNRTVRLYAGNPDIGAPVDGLDLFPLCCPFLCLG